MDELGASNNGASISTTSTSQIDRGIGRFTNLRRSPRFLNQDKMDEPGASNNGASISATSTSQIHRDIETNKRRRYEVDLKQRSLQLQIRRTADRTRRSSDVNQETSPAGASISTSQTDKGMESDQVPVLKPTTQGYREINPTVKSVFATLRSALCQTTTIIVRTQNGRIDFFVGPNHVLEETGKKTTRTTTNTETSKELCTYCSGVDFSERTLEPRHESTEMGRTGVCNANVIIPRRSLRFQSQYEHAAEASRKRKGKSIAPYQKQRRPNSYIPGTEMEGGIIIGYAGEKTNHDSTDESNSDAWETAPENAPHQVSVQHHGESSHASQLPLRRSQRFSQHPQHREPPHTHDAIATDDSPVLKPS